MVKEKKPLPELRECLKTDCKNDLHCFRQKERRKPGQILKGQGCYACGVEQVDWQLVYRRDISKAEETFDYMKKEWIRNKYWSREIDAEAMQHAKKIGKNGMATAITKRIKQSVTNGRPFNDGGQTAEDGDILCYAQHATASCCRKCIEYWHGIPAGKDLTADEADYLKKLMLLYIDARLPNLNEVGLKITKR